MVKRMRIIAVGGGDDDDGATEDLQERLDDVYKAWRMAAENTDRFRDVVADCLGHVDEQPGDDVLITELREHFGRTGPEPTRWREFISDVWTRFGRRDLTREDES